MFGDARVIRYPFFPALARLIFGPCLRGPLRPCHPTVKPIQMVADALLDSTARGEVVLDSFLGSGTTLMAAERVGRLCHGIEIDPVYVDVAIRRWQTYTGQAAIHGLTGQRFDQVAVNHEPLLIGLVLPVSNPMPGTCWHIGAISSTSERRIPGFKTPGYCLEILGKDSRKSSY